MSSFAGWTPALRHSENDHSGRGVRSFSHGSTRMKPKHEIRAHPRSSVALSFGFSGADCCACRNIRGQRAGGFAVDCSGRGLQNHRPSPQPHGQAQALQRGRVDEVWYFSIPACLRLQAGSPRYDVPATMPPLESHNDNFITPCDAAWRVSSEIHSLACRPA